MASRYKDIRDLYFTEEGDFYYDEDRDDFSDTKDDQYRGLLQKIHTRLSSTTGDWAMQADIGSNLGDFVGKPNTQAIGEQIKRRIYSALSNGSLLNSKELAVDVIPITRKKLAIILSINPGDVANYITLTYTYDMRDNKLIPRNL